MYEQQASSPNKKDWTPAFEYLLASLLMSQLVCMHTSIPGTMQEEMRAGQAASMRTEPHPSFQNVMGATLAANKGHFMAPAQLAELAEAQIAAQVLGPSSPGDVAHWSRSCKAVRPCWCRAALRSTECGQSRTAF